MTNEAYAACYAKYAQTLEEELRRQCALLSPAESEVGRAAAYSLLGGGKRMRGCLVQAVYELFPKQEGTSPLPFASAIEMVHAYSLIHDDLPCMDNDDLRRGKPSCHKAFGEATALLAGDALLTMAFTCAASAALPANFTVGGIAALGNAAGPNGMILGQEMDLFYENHTAGEEQLHLLHRKKTGALICAAVELGCYSAQREPVAALLSYAEKIGLVFQVIDDILDVTGNESILGKPVGSDSQNHKNTFVTLYGVQKAYQYASELTEQAVKEVECAFGSSAAFLKAFAFHMLERQN